MYATEYVYRVVKYRHPARLMNDHILFSISNVDGGLLLTDLYIMSSLTVCNMISEHCVSIPSLFGVLALLCDGKTSNH